MAIERDTARPEVGTMPDERAREWATHHRRTAATSTRRARGRRRRPRAGADGRRRVDVKERREAVIEAALKRGLLTLGCGHRSIRLLPPLDVTEREIDLGAELLCAAIDDVASGSVDERR